jgi:hypothetical protein
MSKSAMSKKIVPIAIVALTALAPIGFASVGTALAHEAIIPRPGFAEALASLQTASSAQTQPASKVQVQVRSTAQSASKAGPFNTGASSDDSGWFKDR